MRVHAVSRSAAGGKQGASRPVEPARPRRRGGKAFTLVEMLVVVGVISLLVAIVMPTVGRARDMAKKAVCITNMSNLGKALWGYAADYQSYPHLSPWPHPFGWAWEDGSFDWKLYGWAKIYGLLQYNNIKGTRKTNQGCWYYGGPIDQIWPGALCPAMDAPRILKYANNAGNYGTGGNFLYYTSFHPWAVGYQWNPTLRAGAGSSQLRHDLRLTKVTDSTPDYWQWVGPWVYLPDDNLWVAQAVKPMELESPARTAEAWDTFDIQTTPNVDWWGQKQATNQFVPGWHAGVTRRGALAMFNGARHGGPPNMLYGDGSVRSDATRKIDPAADGLDTGRYSGLKAYTWPDYDAKFGSYNHLVPVCEFAESQP